MLLRALPARRRPLWALLILLLCGVAPRGVPAQSSQTIEAILVEGNSRLSEEAFRHLLSFKVGETFDADRVRADFRHLWERKFFDDLSVETRPGNVGVVVIFHVVERPLLTSVEFSDIKVLTRTQMEDRLKERDVVLKVGAPVDYAAVKKAEEVLRDSLAQKGYLDALVSSELEQISRGVVAVNFDIKPGVKTRIRSIEFTGNAVFSDRKLRRALKRTHAHSWWRAIRGGSTYHPLVFDQDLESVRQLYLNRGYIDVKIKPTIVEVQEGKPRKKEHKRKKWLSLTVPIEEGRSYRVGALSVEGNTVFTEEEILARIPLRPGMVYSGGLMQVGTASVEAEYGERGYFYVSSSPRLKRHEDGTVDVTLRVDEDQKYFINRIEFVGNTTTRDKVLRRELKVNEQEVFNLRDFRIGMRRISQLGYWRIIQEPEIRPLEGENKVDISIHGREESRNEIQIGGGFSGVDGGFFMASYATRNFLGLGERVITSIQAGGRSDRFDISFEEPYFLGKPVVLGFSIFRRETDFVDFRRRGSGLSLTLGRRIADFQRIRATYLLEDLEIDESGSDINDSSTVTSSLIPMYVLNTVNNPFRPSRGFRLTLLAEYAGGVLGGDNFFVKPRIRTSFYVPAFKHTFFVLHGEAGWVERFGDGLLPLSERFFLGGDIRGPRVFETRSITPIGFRALDGTNDCVNRSPDPADPDDERFFQEFTTFTFDSSGNPVTVVERQPFLSECGGNKFFLTQLEYVIPVGQPLEVAFFFDAGNTFLDDISFNVGDLKMSYGVEARFFLPIFQFPLRLIYGQVVDPEEGEETNSFQFSIGRSF
ncbi:MAG: outer membrane protein assembly factor BamA [Acidobacteriota bacterium]